MSLLWLARWQMGTTVVMIVAASLAIGCWHTLEPCAFEFLAHGGLPYSLTAPFALLLGDVGHSEMITPVVLPAP